MKKRLIALLCTSMITLSLISCGSASSDSSSISVTSSSTDTNNNNNSNSNVNFTDNNADANKEAETEAAKKVVETYFDDIKNKSNNSLTKELVKKQFSSNSTTASIPDYCVDAILNSISRIEVSITNCEVNNGTCVVNLDVNGVNLYSIIQEAVDEASSSVSSDDTKEKLLETYFQLVKEKLINATLESRQAKINLTKVGDTWNITENDADYTYAIWGVTQGTQIK